MIKKIVLNYGYGCWGRPTKISSEHAIFTIKEVKFVKKPEQSCRTNCRIEFKYNPIISEYERFELEDFENDYIKDFEELCHEAESLIGKTSHEQICDAIGSSLEIFYEDGRRIEFGLFVEDGDRTAIKRIYEIADKYAPDFFRED